MVSMNRIMLKSKIHRATVTDVALHYEGSIAMDETLLEAADILPNEQVQVYNINNGERFTTYAICAPRGSCTISLNGAAARLGAPGDKIIVAAYASLPDEEARRFIPKVVYVDDHNRPRRTGRARAARRKT